NKEFTTVEEILTQIPDNFEANHTISFKTFKMQPAFEKINSAPLEDKVYLLVHGAGLIGKEATITVKEKDGLIKGAQGAPLPLLEITEEQMEQNENSEEVKGTEKTTFKATFATNN